jgi:hypothetical protein
MIPSLEKYIDRKSTIISEAVLKLKRESSRNIWLDKDSIRC